MELTRNVMQLNNISVGTGKRITFEDVVFNDNSVLKYINPSRYIKSGHPSSYQKSGSFYSLFQVYTTPLDIGTKYNNGAKYLYGVFPYLHNSVNGNFNGGDLALGLAENTSTTTNIADFATPGDLDKQDLETNGRAQIKYLGTDAGIIKNAQTGDAMFDIVLCEVVLNLKSYYDLGVRYMWIPRVVAETQTINGYSVTPVNTTAKPIAYYIYES